MNEEVKRLESEVAELRTALEMSRSQVESAIRKVQELELAQRVAFFFAARRASPQR